MASLIRMKNIHKKFPGVHALKGVQFDLHEGEIHALMGENGAGKSTLIKVIAGVYSYDGDYRLYDGPAVLADPLSAIRKGVSVIYQELNLVYDLSIAENIFFGRLPVSSFGRVLWNRLYEQTGELLKAVGLSVSPRKKVRYLPVAQQQLVEIAKAISLDARVLIMDEPTSALCPEEIDKLFALMKVLKSKGVGIIYVSHKLDEVFRIADRVTVFRDGGYVGTEKIAALNEKKLINMMVGRELSSILPKTTPVIGETIFDVENLSTEKVRNISFSVKQGEIVGFSGLMGSGRTELAYALMGLDPRISGSIRLAGSEVPPGNPVRARSMGMGLIPEDRKQDGIFPDLGVRENMTIVSLPQVSGRKGISGNSERNLVKTMIDRLSIKTSSMNQLIANLSGGNQQKVIVARWLMNNGLKVLIVDEPTRGIDVGAKAEIYSILDRLAHEGLAIIMMSSEMPEILGMCDRVYVMMSGRINGEFTAEEASQEELLAACIDV
jgi:ABC-type sugar transport system ATPase subunit